MKTHKTNHGKGCNHFHAGALICMSLSRTLGNWVRPLETIHMRIPYINNKGNMCHFLPGCMVQEAQRKSFRKCDLASLRSTPRRE